MRSIRQWLLWILLILFQDCMTTALPPGFKDELVTNQIRIPIGVAAGPKLDGGYFLLINDLDGYVYLMLNPDNSVSIHIANIVLSRPRSHTFCTFFALVPC